MYTTPAPVEGFYDTPPSPTSAIQTKIKSALDKYLNDDLCAVYVQIRKILAENIQGDTKEPTADTLDKVEKYLATELTVPPLPCPTFKYPSAKADLEWVVFLNEIPTDIGARFKLMAIYAQRELKFRAQNVKDGLARKTLVPESQKDDAEKMRIAMKHVLSAFPTEKEGFIGIQDIQGIQGIKAIPRIIGICPMTVADSRRLEKKGSTCTLPEDLTPEEIEIAVNGILEKIVSDTNSVLASKYIDPAIDVTPFIADAKVNGDYITKMKAKALDGSLLMEMAP